MLSFRRKPESINLDTGLRRCDMITIMFTIANKQFHSRLFLGTASYPSLTLLEESLRASGAEIVTVGIRRINLSEQNEEGPIKILKEGNYHILPNTAGCYTAKEAILTAKLAREALQINWIKLVKLASKKK